MTRGQQKAGNDDAGGPARSAGDVVLRLLHRHPLKLWPPSTPSWRVVAPRPARRAGRLPPPRRGHPRPVPSRAPEGLGMPRMAATAAATTAGRAASSSGATTSGARTASRRVEVRPGGNAVQGGPGAPSLQAGREQVARPSEASRIRPRHRRPGERPPGSAGDAVLRLLRRHTLEAVAAVDPELARRRPSPSPPCRAPPPSEVRPPPSPYPGEHPKGSACRGRPLRRP